MELNRLEGNKERIVIFLCFILVFIINIYNINKSNIIYLTTDEQGPFAVAAYLSGRDWSSTTSNLPYYSYGYSFIIWPLFVLIDEPTVLYKACIVVNSLMISSIVLIAYYSIKKIKLNTNTHVSLAISICVALYSCNIVRANLALYEASLIIVSWLIFYLFINIDDKSDILKFVTLGFLLVYSYMIHQRMVGVLIAGILVIIIMRILKKINNKQLFVFVFTISLMMIIHMLLKSTFKTNVWLNSSNSAINDYGSQVNKILQIFTINGFVKFLRGFLGQLFYIGSATYLLGFIGIFNLVKYCLNNIKTYSKKDQKKSIIDDKYLFANLFLLIAIILTLAISVIFMSVPHRADHIVYGRYNEVLFGPLLLISLLSIYILDALDIKKLILNTSVIIISGIFIDLTYDNLRTASFSTVSCIGISQYYYKGELHIYLAMLVTIIIALLIYISSKTKRNFIKVVVLLLLSVVFTSIGSKVLKDSVYPHGEKWFKLNEFVSIVKNEEPNLPVYYLGPESNNFTSSFVQFLFKDKTISYIEEDEMKDIKEDHYLIIAEKTAFELMDKYQVKDTVNNVTLLKYSKNDKISYHDSINLTKMSFDSQNVSKVNSDDIISNGESGYLIYGPYYNIERGSYLAEFEMELVESNNDHIGTIDISANGTQFDKADIEIIDFDENSHHSVTLKFNNKDLMKNFETRVYVNDGNILKIKSVKLTKRIYESSFKINLKNMSLLNSYLDNESIITLGQRGFAVYGPYIPFNKGKYTAKLNIDVLDNLNNEDILFYIDVASTAGDQINKIEVNKGNYKNNNIQIMLPFILDVNVTDLEIRVYTNEGVKLKVNSIQIDEQ